MASREDWPNHVQYREPSPEPAGRDPLAGLRRSLDVGDGEGTCACGYFGPGEEPCPDAAGQPLCAEPVDQAEPTWTPVRGGVSTTEPF